MSYRRHVGQVLEVMVEGKNSARGQMIGRTSQNKTFNFAIRDKVGTEDGRVRERSGDAGVSE